MAANETPKERGLLYRIMDFHRVVQIFEREEIYFAHPSTWDDPYEKFIKHPQSHALFAQCWTRAYSSDAMWRIYSPHGLGVRISTTEDLLTPSARSSREAANTRGALATWATTSSTTSASGRRRSRSS